MQNSKGMRPYLSFFRLRLKMGMQYRSAAVAGLMTQFAWGFLEIFMFHAFYQSNAVAFPMSMQATASYIWLQQGFLTLYAIWFMENEIIDDVSSGNIIYSLCRPLGIYPMWFFRNAAYRISRVLLRCIPLFLLAVLLPKGYRLSGIVSAGKIFPFVVSLLLAFLVTLTFSTLIYVLLFYTISPMGLRIIVSALFDFFSGSVIPLPFFPKGMQIWMEITPFAAMQNVPFRIYNGNIYGNQMFFDIGLQIMWILIFFVVGKVLCHRAEKQLVVQGG